MEAANSNKSARYKEKVIDKFWNKIEELEKIDTDIAKEIRRGNKVTILEDSENNIDLPVYPGSVED